MGYEVDFLPVGDKSGDAIALRFGDLRSPQRSDQVVVLIDGGFKKTAPTIIEHINTYYGTNRIDLVVSTHPDSDHINGLPSVLAGMDVRELWMHCLSKRRAAVERALGHLASTDYIEGVRAAFDSAEELEKLAMKKGIPISEPFTGLQHHSGRFHCVGPTEDFYLNLFREPPPEERAGLGAWLVEKVGEFLATVAESWGWETLTDDGETSPINNSSAITMLTHDGKCLLFTADAGIPALSRAADALEAANYTADMFRFIQVPHHGSRRNVGPTVLNRLVGPILAEEKQLKTAFVSVAPDEEPKHPAKKVTNAFLRRGAPVHVTKGVTKWHHDDAPDRTEFSPSQPLPLYSQVED